MDATEAPIPPDSPAPAAFPDSRARLGKTDSRLLFAARLALLWLFGLLLLNAAPFGLSGATTVATQNLIIAVTSPFYPPGPRAADADADAAVAVEISDRSIQFFRVAQQRLAQAAESAGDFPTAAVAEVRDWPIPYGVHDYLLARLIEMGPAAIVVNVDFQRARPWDASLVSFGERIVVAQQDAADFEDRHVPLYFATGAGRDIAPDGALAHVAANAGDGWRDYGRTSIVSWVPKPSWYPLRLGKAASDDQEPPRTAAMQVFHDLCLGKSPDELAQAELATACGVAARGPVDGTFATPMLLRWPYGHPPLQANVQSVDICPARPDGLWHKVWTATVIVLRRVRESLFSKSAGPLQPCRPVATVGAERLLPDNADTMGQVYALVNGRVVFYGANLADFPDGDASPVHGLLPAVAIHATAYDNLATLGADYTRERAGLTRAAEGGLWLLISLAAAVHMRKRDALAAKACTAAQYARFRRYFVWGLTVLSLGGVVLAFLLWQAAVAPVNFLSLIGLTGLLPQVEAIVARLLRMLDWLVRVTAPAASLVSRRLPLRAGK